MNKLIAKVSASSVTLFEQGALVVLTSVSTFIASNQSTLPGWSGVVLGLVTAGIATLNVLLGKPATNQTVVSLALKPDKDKDK